MTTPSSFPDWPHPPVTLRPDPKPLPTNALTVRRDAEGFISGAGSFASDGEGRSFKESFLELEAEHRRAALDFQLEKAKMEAALDARKTVGDTLAERGVRYGAFKDGASIMQALKGVMHAQPGWARLRPSQRESLDMIVHKIGRILNGDPNYIDSWHDIQGFAKLVEDELHADQQQEKSVGAPAPGA